ncbi:MAG: biotin--[acetyl-CoA-carboxylase] ligase [bacterium]|nr:biotin--[acetyl-CoA-carboxylase] ligase [bacterium]
MNRDLKIVRLEQCDSTNSYIRTRFEELKNDLPVMVTSLLQTGGRGRDNRVWDSRAGKGLYCSFGFHLEQGAGWHLLPLTAGIGIIDTLRRIAGLDTGLKWPNDILYRGRKIAGILIENVIFENRMFCVVGIGINLNHEVADFPVELEDKAVSLREITGSLYDVKEVSDTLADVFFTRLQDLEENRQEKIVDTARQYSRFMEGRPIRFHQKKEIVGGIFRGLNTDGGLILETEDGNRTICYSGEIEQ